MHRLTAPLALAFALVFAGPASATLVNLEASLDCAQTNAGIGTCHLGGSGTGTATITFDTDTNLLSWNLSYSGLSAPVTLVHFHGPALPTQNAGVQVGIGTANPAIGNAVLTNAQESDLLSELWYINVHTSNFPSGEIRGRVLLVPEPAAAALLGVGLLGFCVRGRRRSGAR